MLKKQIRVAAFADNFQQMFLSKDIFLLPYYIAKEMNGNLEYVYIRNIGETALPKRYRERATFQKSLFQNQWLALLWYVVLRARRFEVLFLTGSSAVHMLVAWAFKKINKRAKVVVFGDMEEPQAKELNGNGFQYSTGIVGRVKGRLAAFFMDKTIYCVANERAFDQMDMLCKRKGWRGLLHFYPCLDDEMFVKTGIVRPQFSNKENIMVCVGRIGNYQKNTEMLLGALKMVDLKDWKIYMLGPVTDSFELGKPSAFQRKIDQFFEENPQFSDRLIFTGMVYDSKQVLNYYARAKVLLMTSRHEGFANVYSEASALGCYIVSTDVGGAETASNNWQFGAKLPQEDAASLAKVLQAVVNGEWRIDEKKSLSLAEQCYSHRVKSVLLPKMEAVNG